MSVVKTMMVKMMTIVMVVMVKTMLTMVRKMMVTLNGGEDNLDDEWKNFSDDERRKKMRLFMSMFTNSQEFFQPLLLEMYEDLSESFLKQVRR